MIDEDDTEVILEGGELHKYLQSQGENIKDVYSSSKQAAEPTFLTEKNSNSTVVVPNEVMNILNMILKSDLLLEEDASYLFKRFSELISPTQRRKTFKFIIPGMIIGMSAYGYWKLNSGKFLFSSFMTCSTVYLFSEISNLYYPLKQISKIKQILSNLKDITTYIRKNIKLVQEEDSLIFSKGKLLQLRNDMSMINKHTLNRKKLEIFIICQKLICILKSLIFLSRNVTLAILKKQEQKLSDHNFSYIALYSDEQLGIYKYDEVDEETNVLPFIDILRNIFLVMQSETLRELGLYLCGFTKVEEIISLVDILNQYQFKSAEISLGLKKIHDKHFYPSYVPKKVKSDNKNVRYLGNIVNSISVSLNSLLIDSRNIEHFIDSADEIELDTDQNIIGFKLLKMEREIAYLIDHIHSSALQFLKQTNYFNQNMPPLSSQSNRKIIKTECMVGASDFSINGQDEVFLGLVEGTENTKNDNDYIAEHEKPPELGILINELKSALITKREEFEKREIETLKSPEDIENYKSCSSESSKISVKEKTENYSTINQSATSKNHFSGEVRNAIPLDKDLAIKASDFLKSWNKTITDECFGDDTDDDDEDF